jgi:hypothetical protein
MNGHNFTEEEFRLQLIADLEANGAKDVVITSVFATDDEVVGYFETSNYGSGHYGMIKTEKWDEEYGND